MHKGRVYRNNLEREIHLATDFDSSIQNKSEFLYYKTECVSFTNAFFANFHTSFVGHIVHLVHIHVHCRMYKTTHATDTPLRRVMNVGHRVHESSPLDPKSPKWSLFLKYSVQNIEYISHKLLFDVIIYQLI